MFPIPNSRHSGTFGYVARLPILPRRHYSSYLGLSPFSVHDPRHTSCAKYTHYSFPAPPPPRVHRNNVHNDAWPFVISDVPIFAFRFHGVSLVKYDVHHRETNKAFSWLNDARLHPMTLVPVSFCAIADPKSGMTLIYRFITI